MSIFLALINSTYTANSIIFRYLTRLDAVFGVCVYIILYTGRCPLKARYARNLQLQHGQSRLVQAHCGDIVSHPSPCALFYTCHHTIRRRKCRYNNYYVIAELSIYIANNNNNMFSIAISTTSIPYPYYQECAPAITLVIVSRVDIHCRVYCHGIRHSSWSQLLMPPARGYTCIIIII